MLNSGIVQRSYVNGLLENANVQLGVLRTEHQERPVISETPSREETKVQSGGPELERSTS